LVRPCGQKKRDHAQCEVSVFDGSTHPRKQTSPGEGKRRPVSGGGSVSSISGRNAKGMGLGDRSGRKGRPTKKKCRDYGTGPTGVPCGIEGKEILGYSKSIQRGEILPVLLIGGTRGNNRRTAS